MIIIMIPYICRGYLNLTYVIGYFILRNCVIACNVYLFFILIMLFDGKLPAEEEHPTRTNKNRNNMIDHFLFIIPP